MMQISRIGVAMLGILASSAMSGAVIRVAPSDFIAGSGLITFSELPLGTLNPSYAPGNYGGGPGAPAVTFGGFFLGQSLSATPGLDCPGGAASGCVVGTPTGPLSLAPGAPSTRIVNDGANPTSPVLSGSPLFNGPIAVLFSVDLVGVGLDGGYFDAPGSTKITAYARDGSVIGSIVNTGTGIEFLGLVTEDGSARIAGLLFSLVGNEPAGFAIDNLRFGQEGQVNVPAAIPEPSSFALLGIGLVGLFTARRKCLR